MHHHDTKRETRPAEEPAGRVVDQRGGGWGRTRRSQPSTLSRDGVGKGSWSDRQFLALVPLGTHIAAAMRTSLAQRAELIVRAGETDDLDALVDLENRAFTTDRLSRRSFRNFLTSPAAALIVADRSGRLTGYALVLFRPGTAVARLYSIAVVPELAGNGIGLALLAAAENVASARGCRVLRLEVHVANAPAIARYQKSGFRLIDRRARYYEDNADALRFEKRLPRSSAQGDPPPIHRTTA
jgi:ribosomal protein S18 acetylase RimI-like enzyme